MLSDKLEPLSRDTGTTITDGGRDGVNCLGSLTVYMCTIWTSRSFNGAFYSFRLCVFLASRSLVGSLVHMRFAEVHLRKIEVLAEK